MAARSAVSEMLRTRGSPVLILIAYLNFDRFPTLQEEFNRNINSLAKWIEGAIQRFRSGVKNSRVIELHNTCHYVFIVDEALVVRETRKFLLDERRCSCGGGCLLANVFGVSATIRIEFTPPWGKRC